MTEERGTVVAVCISERRGTEKHEIARGKILPGYGLEGDAHGGNWHRQISLLSYDKVLEFNRWGGAVGNGDFGENILVAGIDLARLPVGTRLRVGDALLEVTQIGKECHSHCAIFHRVGDCFCGHCNRIRLSSAGRLAPCLCLPESIDLRPALAAGETALCAAIREGILSKPARHHFEPGVEAGGRTMSQVGG